MKIQKIYKEDGDYLIKMDNGITGRLNIDEEESRYDINFCVLMYIPEPNQALKGIKDDAGNLISVAWFLEHFEGSELEMDNDRESIDYWVKISKEQTDYLMKTFYKN